MATITVDVAGRCYPVECGDDQEKRLLRLARRFDLEARALERQLGRLPDALLLLLAGLMVADEMEDRIERLEAAGRALSGSQDALPAEDAGARRDAGDRRAVLAALSRATRRMEALTASLSTLTASAEKTSQRSG